MNYEYNPFENQEVASEWINSVENEKGLIRDKELYPYLKKWIRQVNPNLVVEIGSGQGICSTKLGNFPGQYIGVEPSEFLVKRAQDIYPTTNRSFVVGNAYNLPIVNEWSDAVFSVNVWFHLEILDQAAKELSRVLKINGQFLIITANPESIEVWRSFYFDQTMNGKLIKGKVVIPVNNLSDSTFYNHSLEGILASLKSNNLTVDNVEKLGFVDGNNYPLFIAIEGHK